MIILLITLLASNLFLSVMLALSHRAWRRALKRAQRVERTLNDVFDVNGAGMTLAREIQAAKCCPPRLSKADWERRMNANPRPRS